MREDVCPGCVSTSYLASTDRSVRPRRAALSPSALCDVAIARGKKAGGRNGSDDTLLFISLLSDLHLPPWWLTLAVDTIIAIRLFQTQASTGCEL